MFVLLPSLSIMVILATSGMIVMPSGVGRRSKKLRETANASMGSEMVSSVIGISAQPRLSLAVNVS